MRATASSTPVSTPPRTARSATVTMTFQRGAPRAAAASRMLLGTSRSMFSVVRITTGMTMSASAHAPAQPGLQQCPQDPAEPEQTEQHGQHGHRHVEAVYEAPPGVERDHVRSVVLPAWPTAGAGVLPAPARRR